MREGRAHSPAGLSDADLAARLRDGDAHALGVLYDRHVAGIHDFLARFTRDPAAAEDLAQTTFLRAWERRGTLRDPARARSWLYATAHHLALDHVARARRGEPVEDDSGAAVANSAPGPEPELVWAAAASLESRQYAVLDLSVRRGLSTREVADVVGVPVGRAAVLVSRARDALGSAVRYLVVVRRRDHCLRLAALVPAGVRVLTPQERSAVDHHLRRCDVCGGPGARLTSPAELFGALLPLPLPAALGSDGRLRLVAAAHARPSGGASPGGARWPSRRAPWDGRPRWAVALAIGLLLAVGASASAGLLLRPSGPTPAEGLAAPGPSGSPGAPQALAPTPSEPPAPGPTVAPSPTTPPPAVPALSVRASPSPAASARPSPAPSGSPSTPATLVVRQASVRWDDARACPMARSQVFVCHFTVTLTVSGADGRSAVTGTLTAATLLGERATAALPATVPAAGATTVAVAVTATFRSSPCGAATVATRTPNAVTSQPVPFGACPLALLVVGPLLDG